ncbi:hydroxylase [Mycolicibacterium sp. GF69]|uniref:SDR family oxidoreductase n=1 Tax=Mycolicibacterium sp. GF69 TaxID=2267251 RepID=UPI000DCDF35D|nr:NAD(P)H-binding protein [Mycolicibacterium sp. GF69]RAV16325.1 hydroxylase [Mycolicibacterium sp. GF69]
MTILVTGATGNIGRRIVDHLIELGCNDIRALTTNPAKAGLPDGVAAITGYLGRPDTLPAALEGVDRLYLAPLPSTLDVTLELVEKAGVEYVVALSGAGDWQEHADKITASGLISTQLGPGEFTDNFTVWGEQIRAARTVRDPYPSVVESPISMDDIARVAARLLVDPDESHYGKTYPITGPRALTRAEIAGQIGAGIGVDVAFEQCSRPDAEEALRPIMGEYAVWYLDEIQKGVDKPQQANTLVAELTGTPAQSVAQWAADNASIFR